MVNSDSSPSQPPQHGSRYPHPRPTLSNGINTDGFPAETNLDSSRAGGMERLFPVTNQRRWWRLKRGNKQSGAASRRAQQEVPLRGLSQAAPLRETHEQSLMEKVTLL